MGQPLSSVRQPPDVPSGTDGGEGVLWIHGIWMQGHRLRSPKFCVRLGLIWQPWLAFFLRKLSLFLVLASDSSRDDP